MTHWYEVLNTLKSVNEKEVKVDEKVKNKSYSNTKVTNNTFDTNCSSLKDNYNLNFFFSNIEIQLYLIVVIFLFFTDIIITINFNSFLFVFCLEGKMK